MSNFKTKDNNNVPLDYFYYYSKPGYFITHYGEIYPGTIKICPNYKEGIFIIANHNLEFINNLTAENMTPEVYRLHGWEIRDFNIILKVVDSLFPKNHPEPFIKHTDIRPDDYKRMFVFGAASSKYCLYDSLLQKNLEQSFYCPPLGNELFDNRFDETLKQYPGVLQSIDEWDLEGKDIEQFLEKQWQYLRYNYDPMVPPRHINVQYYLQVLFNTISDFVVKNHFRSNLFNTFIETIRKVDLVNETKTTFVSFNYDTILDTYLENYYGIEFTNMDSYLDKDLPFCFLKPHGSANWGFQIPKENIPKEGQSNFQNWLFRNKITISEIYFNLIGKLPETLNKHGYGLEYGINSDNKISKFTIDKDRIQILPNTWKHEYYYPALLMPYRDKDEFVMPYHHQLGLELLCQATEELYLIGWKGNEDLFNRQFKERNNLKRIIIVNPNPEEVKRNLGQYINLENIAIIEIPDFKTFVIEELNNHLNGRF